MSASKENAAIVGVGAVACAVCCAGPILGILAAIGPGREAPGHSETSTETVLGLNLESNALVIVAVAMSLTLGALAWFRNRRRLLLATVAFAVIFAMFDIAEVAHQLTESRSGLATLGAAIALVHLATALVAQQRATTVAPQQPAS